MFRNWNKHLKEQDETYFQHMWSAWKIVYLLVALSAKCFIHSIFPFLYTKAVSKKIECLRELTMRGKK